MREILFRGKRCHDGRWVDGNLFIPDLPDAPTQILMGTNAIRIAHDIIPSTVGQYTGLKDKNGTKVFEGDIVHCLGGEYAFGFWEHNNTFALTNILYYVQMGELCESEFIEVIGNIHDNPELLEVE